MVFKNLQAFEIFLCKQLLKDIKKFIKQEFVKMIWKVCCSVYDDSEQSLNDNDSRRTISNYLATGKVSNRLWSGTRALILPSYVTENILSWAMQCSPFTNFSNFSINP